MKIGIFIITNMIIEVYYSQSRKKTYNIICLGL